jgi:serine/threonine-protein kinase
MDGTRLRTLHATEGGAHANTDEDGRELVGRVLDRRYRLDAVIGQGAMGVVYRATHTLIGRSFAVKVLRRQHLESPDVARRFLLEARVASSIKHPNVVDISDFGELPEGGAYYVMEMLEGDSLASAIDKRGPMSLSDAGLVALQIASGLAAAHGMGVVHRDLKPDNVFLCSPRRGVEHPVVKLLDFGIARVGPRRITVAGAVLGTPEYMSPEMCQGHDVDHRADLYALGVILFELLTATVPFYHKEITRTIEMHVRAPRPTPASRRPELAKYTAVAQLIEQLMAVAREDRPSSAEVVGRTLAAALSHDLDKDAAAVVHRATLAMGSNLLGDLADPSRPAEWPPSQPWPQRVPASSTLVDTKGTAAATVATPIVVHASGVAAPRSRGGAKAALAAFGAAIVAGGVTFGVVRMVGIAAPAEAAPTSATDESVMLADPAPTPSVGATATSGTPAAVIAELPTPPPVVISATPVVAEPDAKPPASAERTKTKRRKNDPVPKTTPASTPTNEAPGTNAPKSDPSPSEPHPKPVGPKPPASPRDLKDPFPKK